MNPIYRRRRLVNGFNLFVSMLTVAFGLFWLAWILWTLVDNGLHAINLTIFMQSTPPPGSNGGLANAIIGSLLMTSIAVLIGMSFMSASAKWACTWMTSFCPLVRGGLRPLSNIMCSCAAIQSSASGK